MLNPVMRFYGSDVASDVTVVAHSRNLKIIVAQYRKLGVYKLTYK